MITIKYYQLYCPKNKKGREEAVACSIDLERISRIYRDAEDGVYNNVWLTAKPPYFVREMELDYDIPLKAEVYDDRDFRDLLR